jgi:hypothetical protein
MKILSIILAAFCLLLIGGGIFGYFYLTDQWETKIEAAESKTLELETTYGTVEEAITVYAVLNDRPYGGVVTEEDLTLVTTTTAAAANAITDIEEYLGWFYRVNLTAGTVLTVDTVMQFPQTDDERVYDVILDYSTIGLDKNDFVDIRIQMPMGEDYIALSHKRVDAVYGNIIKLVLNELDIAIYNSLLSDSILFDGALLYATKYLEPGSQGAAAEFYPISVPVLRIALRDPNIAQGMDYDAHLTKRTEMEGYLAEVLDDDILRTRMQQGKNIIPDKIGGGESIYQTEKELEEQRRLEEALYGNTSNG